MKEIPQEPYEAALISKAALLPLILGWNRLRIFIFSTLLKFIEKAFGAQLFFKVPDKLADTPQELLPHLPILYRFKQLGIVAESGARRIFTQTSQSILFRYRVGLHGWGGDFFDSTKAFWRAFGENLERSLWLSSTEFFTDDEKKSVRYSYDEMPQRETLNPERIAGFTPQQRKAIPSLHFTKKTPLLWTKARSLIQNKDIYCPVQLLSGAYYQGHCQSPINTKKSLIEPTLRWAVTTGLATGRTLPEALTRGFLEVIERDAFMITWLNRLPIPQINLEDLALRDTDIQEIVSRLKKVGLELHVSQLPTDFPVQIYIACVIDHKGEGPCFTIGASASCSAKKAVLAASAEAISIHFGIESALNKEIDLRNLDRDDRVIYWARNPMNLARLSFLFKGNLVQIPQEQWLVNEDSPGLLDQTLDKIMDYARSMNYEALYAELTSKKIQKLGFRTIYALIPELQPLHLHESAPYFGGDRIKSIPRRLGYTPARVINSDPHPFP